MVSNRTMPDASVVPVLEYDDVAAAIDWLCRVFGFAVRWRLETHRAQLAFGNGAVVVRDRSAEGPPTRSWVMVRLDDVDAHHDRARALGARITASPTDHRYGERQYSAEDLGGHRWLFSESVEDVAPEDFGAVSNLS